MELAVKRHQVSSSAPTLGSPLVNATRSPGRLRRSASISSGNKPDAKVFAPASSSMAVFITINSSYYDRRRKIHHRAPDAGASVRSNHDESRRMLHRHQNLTELLPAVFADVR